MNKAKLIKAIKLNKELLKEAKTPHEKDQIRQRINILKSKLNASKPSGEPRSKTAINRRLTEINKELKTYKVIIKASLDEDAINEAKINSVPLVEERRALLAKLIKLERENNVNG